MIAIVAPEPASWLPAVIAAASATAPVTVIGRWLWPVGRGAQRLWARGAADRRIRAQLATRAAADGWAAARLAAMPELTAVIAPTGAARRCFVAAERRGAARVLISDLPCLRQLHCDLDRAAQALPDRRFLRRYRADRDALVRQEAEWVLADLTLIRGAYARDVHIAAGVAPGRLIALPHDVTEPPTRRAGDAILLAGLAAARNGTDAALAAIEGTGRRLMVRSGEGTEPVDLLARPGVIAAPRDVGRALDGVAVVITPAWCESYAPEVRLAGALGVPIVATRAAAGFESALEVAAGDRDALRAAIDRALAAAPPARAAPDREALRAAIAVVVSGAPRAEIDAA